MREPASPSPHPHTHTMFTLPLALLALAAAAVRGAVIIRPAPELPIERLPPVGGYRASVPTRQTVWTCSPLDVDEFPLDARRSNILDAVLVCAYPAQASDTVGSYCTYDLVRPPTLPFHLVQVLMRAFQVTGALTGDYNAGFCPSIAVAREV